MSVSVCECERERGRELGRGRERAHVRVRAVVGDQAEKGQASSHQVLTDSHERHHDGMQRNGTATTPHSVREEGGTYGTLVEP